MRVRRQKQVRRHVRFYKSCYGFREPFKVLCDGNFVHAMLAARIGSLRDTLPSLLGGGARPFVTRCVIGELKKLGNEFSGTVLAARRLDTAKCDHDPQLSAIDCLEAMVAGGNPEHFFVATQDAELRQKLRQVPGGAIIYLQNTGLILEQPSPLQVSHARLLEAERSHLADREGKILLERAKRKAAQTSDGSLAEDFLENQQSSSAKRRPRRAKGPNPLSQKKKKKKVTEGNSLQVLGSEETMTKRKRQRHRVRHRKASDNDLPAKD